MIDYSKFPNRSILCIDMKSFYASCSAVMLGLDPMTCYLAVVADTARQGSVVLAASPALKQDFKIKTGSRLFEIPNHSKIHIVNPSMSTYIKISTELTKLFNRYVPFSDMLIYSIDEAFLDVTGVKKLWGTPVEIAFKIQNDIQREFGLPSTAGIAPNMLLAKLCLDLEAKKTKEGISQWTYDDVRNKLWSVTPLSQMWGIGSKVEKTLNSMGIFSVGDLAKFPLHLLEKKFGVLGNQLYYHAWGIDLSKIDSSIQEKQVRFGKSQILLRDYRKESEVKVVILEMCEDVAKRARDARKAARTISLGLGYSKVELEKGFQRSRTIDYPTNITMDIYKVCLDLLKENYKRNIVRQISISLSNLVDDDNMQLNLFEEDNWKRRELGYVVDSIRNKYGSTALLHAVSYTDAGTSRYRSSLVGGHKK
ncbi:DNA polymerase thumb domain-containing protein [Metabacillus fastidiosus]|uniref:Y-family DNA polymerase n=1 Tax=Metabacillus fastidiosus TaxID=1458 RepID=UPI002E1FBBDB|nr:UV damage repair protein UvrX [Metabacillus fastidiosus]